MTALPPSTPWQRAADVLSESFGLYRLSAWVRGHVIVPGARVKSPSRLRMARRATLQHGSLVHCGGKAWSGFAGHVRLGAHVVVGPHCVLYGAGGLEIGDYTHLGPGAQVMTQSGTHGPERMTPSPRHALAAVQIGAGCWIGAGAVILGGSRLGRCVTVAPNSVVAGATIPDFAIVVGNPARVIGFNEEFA